MFGLGSLMGGGGGGGTSSSATAKSSATGSTIGDTNFGDKIIGGNKFSPWTLGIIALGIVGAIWAWKQ